MSFNILLLQKKPVYLKRFSLKPQFCNSTVNNSQRCNVHQSFFGVVKLQAACRLPSACSRRMLVFVHQQRVSDVTRDKKKRATDMEISHAPPQSLAFSCIKEQNISWEWRGLMPQIIIILYMAKSLRTSDHHTHIYEGAPQSIATKVVAHSCTECLSML